MLKVLAFTNAAYSVQTLPLTHSPVTRITYSCALSNYYNLTTCPVTHGSSRPVYVTV